MASRAIDGIERPFLCERWYRRSATVTGIICWARTRGAPLREGPHHCNIKLWRFAVFGIEQRFSCCHPGLNGDYFGNGASALGRIKKKNPRWADQKKKKMLFDRLSASPALRTFNITDLEQYRATEKFVDSESIPLRMTSFSVSRAVLTLPRCTVMLAQSFPRLLDAVYRRANPLVVLMAEKPNGLIHNGIEVNSRSIAFAQGRSDYRVREEASNWYFSAMFTRSVEERGWPEVIDRFELFNASCQSMNTLRLTLAGMFTSASEYGGGELNDLVLDAMEDSLLLALDRAFRSSDVQLIDQRPSASSLRLVREIDARLEHDPSATIYSGALARELGVSVRTLHSATISIRGMSLHRYLKTKRLWLVYRRLLSAAPGARVKSIALQHGFWHMGEFSADYQRLFGELPSKTLALAQLRPM